MTAIRIRTDTGEFDAFPERVAEILSKVVSDFGADGARLRGYRSPDTTPVWIRDHTHQLKAAKYFDSREDLVSPYDFFIGRQKDDGSFFEKVSPGQSPGRVECEADVEYLMVLGALRVWQATGDTEWLRGHLPALERGLEYLTSEPIRWAADFGLAKRPFTIDTWDFQYMDRIPEDGRYRTKLGPYSRFGIMHGDNSGVFAAARGLSEFWRHIGDSARAERWLAFAEGFRHRANRLLYNGTYYRHFHHLDAIDVPGVDEEEILSLSNTYDVNRGLPPHAWAVRIVDEYARRARVLKPRPFAPWFTIQPCLPAEGFGNLGHEFGPYRYINGGLMPFVGGELARAALEHGREAFGVEQLRTYVDMVTRTGQAYFCYRYDGSPDLYRDSIVPNDGWGASAMFYALVEGLAGVEDLSCTFERVRLSPRWPAAGVREAEVRVGYAACGAEVRYAENVDMTNERLRFAFEASGGTKEVYLHLMLPAGFGPGRITLDGKEVSAKVVEVESSRYVDLCVAGHEGECVVDLDREAGRGP